jgi:hypothetical protein
MAATCPSGRPKLPGGCWWVPVRRTVWSSKSITLCEHEQRNRHQFCVVATLDACLELMRKLLVVHRLLEAEERLTKREPPAEPT